MLMSKNVNSEKPNIIIEEQMKRIEGQLLLELMKDCRRSDRELAKILNVSQPTVSRLIKHLNKDGTIKEYTIIPDLAQLGNDFIAITLLSFSQDKPDLFEKARDWTKKQPSIIYASNGEGFGMNSVMVSVHKNYSSYSKLISKLRRDWQPNLKDSRSFIISMTRPELLIKPLSFKYPMTEEPDEKAKE